MPRELTQLEQEVASHPAVAYYREHGLPGLKDVLLGAAEAPSPRQAARAWEEESARVMGLVTLLAKIKRDRRSAEDDELLEDLPKVLGGESRRFLWEDLEYWQRVAAERKRHGQLKVYILVPFSRDVSWRINGYLREFLVATLGTGTTLKLKEERSLVIPHLLSCSPVGYQVVLRELTHPVILVDPPGGITRALKGMDRAWCTDRAPIALRLPRNDMTMYAGQGEGIYDFVDRPLHGCLVVSLEGIAARHRAAVMKRMRASGIRVWCSRAKDRLSFVIVKDKWGSINEIPKELYRCFSVGNSNYSPLVYMIHA